MEATEIAERIEEHAEGRHHPAPATLRRVAGVYIGVVAMLLAIASLGGSEATKEMLNANIHATDTYAFYQAKYGRQIQYQTAAEQLEVLAEALPALGNNAKVGALIKRYRDTAARYEEDPDSKAHLLARAQSWEHVRDHEAARLPNFEYAEALYQIAIVLGSVSIVAASSWILGLSGILAALGTLLTVNGYFLLV